MPPQNPRQGSSNIEVELARVSDESYRATVDVSALATEVRQIDKKNSDLDKAQALVAQKVDQLINSVAALAKSVEDLKEAVNKDAAARNESQRRNAIIGGVVMVGLAATFTAIGEIVVKFVGK
ncbi:MAG: hypothetical protein NVS9B9_17270 [Ktedonobacteraceae bacterium]